MHSRITIEVIFLKTYCMFILTNNLRINQKVGPSCFRDTKVVE